MSTRNAPVSFSNLEVYGLQPGMDFHFHAKSAFGAQHSFAGLERPQATTFLGSVLCCNRDVGYGRKEQFHSHACGLDERVAFHRLGRVDAGCKECVVGGEGICEQRGFYSRGGHGHHRRL